MVFLKLENSGTSWSHLAAHSKDLLESLHNSSPFHCKERVPKDVLTKFDKLTKHVLYFSDMGDHNFIRGQFLAPKEEIDEGQMLTLEDIQKRAKGFGVSYMVHVIEKLKEIPNAKDDETFSVLYESVVNSIPNRPHKEYRFGKEVILTQKELSSSLAPGSKVESLAVLKVKGVWEKGKTVCIKWNLPDVLSVRISIFEKQQKGSNETSSWCQKVRQY